MSGLGEPSRVDEWPRVQGETCSTCGARGTVTVTLAPIRRLCDACLPVLDLQHGGESA